MIKVSSLLGNGSQLVLFPQELGNGSQLVLFPQELGNGSQLVLSPQELGNGSQLVLSPQELRNCSQLVLSPHACLWAPKSESKQFPFQLDGHKNEDLSYGFHIIVSYI